MSRGMSFQVGSYDVTTFSEAELWARMNGLARCFAALTGSFRMLAYSRPFPLDAPLERIKERMAYAADPRSREQIAAYRRFLEGIVRTACLKDATYYLLVFDDAAPHGLANTLAAGLRLPVQPVDHLPPLFEGAYREEAAYVRPVSPARGRPYLGARYSYDLRGQLSFGTILSFLQLPFPLSLAVDVGTVHPKKAVRTLQMAANKLKAELLGRSANEAPDPEKEQGYRDVLAALHAVQQERLGLHQVTIGVVVEGRTPGELAGRLARVEATAVFNQIALRRPLLHQADVLALFTSRPTPDTVAGAARNVLSPAVALLSPFGHEVPKETEGPLVAINRATGSPLWLDKFNLAAYNEVTLGRTGSGKTFCAGLRAYRDAGIFDVQTIFIDPQGNFQKVTDAVNGRYNRLRLGTGTALNILDVVHDHPAAQVSHVVVLLETILGRRLTIGEKAAVDRCLLALYHDAGVEVGHFRAERMPLLEDLVCRLESRGPSDLARDLERFVSGSLAAVFNAPTTLSLDLDRRHKIVTFDVSDLEGEFQPAFIYALLSSVERVIRNRRHEQLPTNIVIDEFGILSSIPALAEAAGMLAKRVRAWKVGIQCLDQNWATFDTSAGRRILENSVVKVVMRVDETAAPAIVSNLGLTGHHAEVIRDAGVGEGIMLVGSKPYHVFFQASPAEIEMLTPYARRAAGVVELPTRRR